MYVRNGANGPQEANEFERANRSFVTQANEIPPQAPSWSCNTLCGVEQSISNGCFFLPSATQNESTKHKHFLGDFPRDPLDDCENSGMGLWIPRCIPPDMGAPNVQSDRVPDEVTSNIIQLLDSMSTKTPPVHNEKKKNEVARKCRRSKPSNKELMELYRISCPSGSKDRHSKVATARGPRDRRMRLSVETAIKFFHVQDRLGFDQPSKAVEWLIEKCRPAIDELPRLSQSEILNDLSPPMSADLQSDPAKFVMNCEENLVTNASSAQRKRNRNSKLTLHDPSRSRPQNLKELKTKAKDRSGEGTKCRSYGRKGQARCSPHVIENPAETLNFEDTTASNGYKLNQGLEGNWRRLLNMHGNEFTSTFGGMQKLPNSVENTYFKYAQCSPDMLVQSYPYQQQEVSSVQSAESFSGPNSTAFSVPSCPFPQVMPSISIDPQSTTLKF